MFCVFLQNMIPFNETHRNMIKILFHLPISLIAQTWSEIYSFSWNQIFVCDCTWTDLFVFMKLVWLFMKHDSNFDWLSHVEEISIYLWENIAKLKKGLLGKWLMMQVKWRDRDQDMVDDSPGKIKYILQGWQFGFSWILLNFFLWPPPLDYTGLLLEIFGNVLDLYVQ